MKKKLRRLARKAARPVKTQQEFAWSGYEAARITPARSASLWISLDPRNDLNDADRDNILRAARDVVANSPYIARLVDIAVDLTGVLHPLPSSSDEEWNRLARAYFRRKADNPRTFSLDGRLNWTGAQHWIERRCIIDGDSLTVLTRDPLMGAGVALYYTTQLINSDGLNVTNPARETGINVDAHGRVISYTLSAPGGPCSIPGCDAILYHHLQDPARVRGIPELAPVINTGKDLHEINSYLKQSVKLSSTFGLIETRPEEDKSDAQAAFIRQRQIKQQQQQSSSGDSSTTTGGNGSTTQQSLPVWPLPGGLLPQPYIPYNASGTSITTLDPGHKLEAIQDTRPSQETREYIRTLINSLALGLGLPADIIYHLNDLSSASTRIALQEVQTWRERRLVDREAWCKRVYHHIIADAIANGDLPDVPDWDQVTWIRPRDLTIDKGRDGNLLINLEREGLASRDQWTLATEGRTSDEIITERARHAALARNLEERYKLPAGSLLPGALGATNTVAAAPAEPPAEATDATAEDKPDTPALPPTYSDGPDSTDGSGEGVTNPPPQDPTELGAPYRPQPARRLSLWKKLLRWAKK